MYACRSYRATVVGRLRLCLILIGTLGAPAISHSDDLILDVIPLHHRPAQEPAPLVRDFVAKDGTLKAVDSKLIVRSHPDNLKELRDLIAKLDVPQRRLLVAVKQLSGERARRAGEIDGGRIWRTEGRDDDSRIQQIRVLEDKEAFIDIGREIPISDFAVAQSQSGTIMEQKTRYIGATTGFYVRPHLDGEIVRVDIIAHQKAGFGVSSPPEFDTQALHTTVSGRLGEWITIGVGSAHEKAADVIEYSASTQDEQERRILLQVTVTP